MDREEKYDTENIQKAQDFLFDASHNKSFSCILITSLGENNKVLAHGDSFDIADALLNAMLDDKETFIRDIVFLAHDGYKKTKLESYNKIKKLIN